MPASLHTASTLYELDAKATLLVMLDSAYNHGVQQWLDLFARTEASIACGVSMQALELLFPGIMLAGQ